jgi:hypothetical protein
MPMNSRQANRDSRRPIAIRVTAALLAATAAIAASAAPAAARRRHCTSGACAARHARDLLHGRVLIRFTDTGSISVPSSLDQRLNLCSDGRYVYDTVSNLPDVGATTNRTTGRWKVLWARFSADGTHGRARIRGMPDNGQQLSILVTTDGHTTRVDGRSVDVHRSDVCS